MVETFDCEHTSLKKGSSKGAEVALLQTHLKTLGYYTSYGGHYLKIDGEFGTYTKLAVEAFQRATGHDDDGWFGPKTCKSLNEKIIGKTVPEVKTQTGTASQNTVAVATKTAVDPYKIDTSKNVVRASDANLHIQGIHFVASNVTFNTAFTNGNWKSVDLMNGNTFVYQGHKVPRSYTVETYLKRAEYQKLKGELFKLGNQVCNVTSNDVENGRYVVSFKLALQKMSHYKLTIDLTEYFGG